MDLGNIGLDELSQSASKASGSLDGLGESLEKTAKTIEKGEKEEKKLIDKVGETAKKFTQLANSLVNLPIQLANFANQLDQLDTQHQLFNQKWAARFQEFEFQKESAMLSLKGAEIANAKANMKVLLDGDVMAADIAKARLQVKQAELAFADRLISEQETYLAYEKAFLGLEQARLALRQAEIQADRAELDYTNKLMQIQSNLLSARKAAAEAPQAYVKALESIYEPFIKIDQAAATYTKTVGGSRDSMLALRKETIDLANERHLQAKYNTSVEELITLQTKYNAEIGRSVKLTNDQKESLAALKQVYGDEKALEFASKLSTFGYDMTRASGLAGKLFAEASKRGIALDKYSKNLLTNIKMAQTLTFEKGVNGLKEMAARATELNFNMQETAKASEKLSTLEGALEASSQLAVLGGNFALYSNPLAMFHDALTDAESLQDRIVNQFSGLANWDSNRGEIYMGGGDRIRLREAAKAMGMDPAEVTNMVFEKARRDKLAPEIDSLGVNGEIRRLLSNVAQLDENGNGYVNINGQKTSLREASMMNPEELSRILRTQNNSDSDNIAEIAEGVLSIKDNVEGWSKSFGDVMSQSLEQTGWADSYGRIIKGEASTYEIMSEYSEAYLSASKEKAEWDRQVAVWQKKYAEATNAYEKEMALIGLKQAKLGETNAQYNLMSAQFALQHAKIAKDAAPLITSNLKIQTDQTKRFAEAEARLNLARLDLSLRQAQFQNEVQIPIQEKELEASWRQAKRMDDLYELQRLSIVLQAAQTLANPLALINPAVALIGGAVMTTIAAVIGAKGGAFGKLFDFDTHWDNAKEIIGKDTNGSKRFNHPDIAGMKDYASHFNPDDIKFATGGVVRGDRRFYDGGLMTLTDNIGGLLIGPSHADGGIRIEAQGGEYIMPREQTAMYYNVLDAMRNKSFPTGNGSFNSMSVNNTNTSIFSGRYWGESPTYNGGEPLRLDVSGKITLDLSGSTANIDAEDLLREPLLSQLVAAISRSQNNYMNYGVASEQNLFSPWRQ